MKMGTAQLLGEVPGSKRSGESWEGPSRRPLWEFMGSFFGQPSKNNNKFGFSFVLKRLPECLFISYTRKLRRTSITILTSQTYEITIKSAILHRYNYLQTYFLI